MNEPTTPPPGRPGMSPTTPPSGQPGISRDDRPIRLEALRLAVQTVENAPFFPSEGGKYASIRAAVDDEGGAVLVLAERYRAFLEGEAQ